MTLNISGTLVKVLEPQTGKTKAGKDWIKQDFVLDTGAEYRPEVCFTLFGEKNIAQINGLAVGTKLEVSFSLSSNEYKGKYYTSANAFAIYYDQIMLDKNSAHTQIDQNEVFTDTNEDLPF
ncbi:MAG: hypothetical protein GOVbin568_38 [Prokaryotic dsDNA virus sp.]|nr:MAG: hypothetical protein GOVbin568_38 [Prokaryotic dsDNA virus sp.]|tara:strand:+ start:5402 stop:5764 length:363 start_codon:yes stop_codon:yes gene_type:complete